MHSRCRLITTLLCLALARFPAARGQSCAEQIRLASSHAAQHTVSAKELQIPSSAWHHFEKARTASERSRPEIVTREVAQALRAAPRFAEAYLLLAAQEVQAGHAEAALQLMASARAIDPDLRWSAVVLAGALNQEHRFSEAAAVLHRAPADEAATWQAEYERARAETGRGDAAAALHWSQLAVAAAPVGCTQARLVRANALGLAGRSAEVPQELESFLAEDRDGTRRADVLLALQQARRNASSASRPLLAMKQSDGTP